MTPLISVTWLHQNLGNPKLVILEAGIDIEDYQNNRSIHGTRYFDLKNTFRDLSNPLPNTLPNPEEFQKNVRLLCVNKDSIIVVYDRKGIYFSPRVWWLFNVMGHSNIAILDGGLPAWVNQGFTIEDPSEKKYKIGSFTANFQKNLVRYYPTVLENTETQNEILIDVRSRGRFNGTEKEPRKGLRSGNIPHSINLPYTEVLSNGKYKSLEEIKSLLSKAELLNKPFIFSCGSGITACIIMLAAELVSSTPKSVYDGSWTEWVLKESKSN
ncbi:MAG: sulfurtransferase [Eudoraea sp.]